MNRHHARTVAIGVVAIMLAGALTPVLAEEKKEIPDHAGFQSCQPCHAEKQSMWDASNHEKAIRQTVHNNPSTTECAGCHGSKAAGSAHQNNSATPESHHKASCLGCHSLQKTAYDHRLVADPQNLCTQCHSQGSVFLGVGAKGIDDSRNFHSGVPCFSCHMTEGNHAMKVLRPDDPGLTGNRQDTCTACHKDNNRESRVKQIHEWQSTYEENMEPLRADIRTLEAALKKNPGLLNPALRSKFDDVKANLAILERDGSRGFHNFVFSLEITSSAARDLKEIKTTLK